MVRRRRGTSQGGGAFALVLLTIIGLPLTLSGYLSGPSKPSPVPTAYAALPASSAPSSGTLQYYGGFSPDAVQNTPQVPAAPEAAAPETLYVSGGKVALRADPKPKGKILGRYGVGDAFEVVERSDGWVHVRYALTQREGWIQAKRLRTAPPEAEPEKPEPAKTSPTLSTAEIRKRLIADSIASYPGPCACPYQSARNGSSCGRRAAYVRPGGYAPLCFAKDVTAEMIDEYRSAH
ncbi:SH3 domain-containing protein [Methylobacterium sp. J-088]|uniref:SH3 domain-containing protein n=1 Tax=Methylobacterium sp. J-088 TaxID=2836664 RepID=UPI001FB8B121|nr:SH3 domain-containing protein [Methylobacterium sp. J-088]MCJ2065870.1 SH3 domain-containing protein [Methylobacterium sp. J-088]